MARSERVNAMIALCDLIPEGSVIGYGVLGSLVGITGVIAGRWMNQYGKSTHWWRVVGSNGEIRTYAYNPEMGAEQERRLRSEGVRFLSSGRVDPKCFIDPDQLGG